MSTGTFSILGALRELADRRPAYEQISYPYLDMPEPDLRTVEIWPAGAVRWSAKTALNPQNGPNGPNRTGVHVVLDQDFADKRWTRAKGRALCETPSHRFWDLVEGPTRDEVTCQACERLALRHGIDLTLRPTPVSVGDLWQRAFDGEPCSILVTDRDETTGLITPVFHGIFRSQNATPKPCSIRAAELAARWSLVHTNRPNLSRRAR